MGPTRIGRFGLVKPAGLAENGVLAIYYMSLRPQKKFFDPVSLLVF